ncbi:unnamed protein product [Allacma fusca]|uniref:HAT C-terminal dimerisation domain-containing protein n=1 Tax=Allacma fusca TaxID=39272 RepID=A0A8J2PJS8_9HEXA|nr:unnamed protein product [Allacma fusca]
MNILESRYSMEKRCSGQPGLPHPPNVQTNVQTKQGSLLQHIAEAKRLKESNILEPTKQEIDRYMALPYEKEDSNPLDFWKLNESIFPILSKLARIYLGFPASSGSAERLFSIAGAL